MTLLENLIKVNGRKGGTIHQYMKDNFWGAWAMFETQYIHMVESGFEFTSTQQFDYVAKLHSIKIN